MVLVLEDGLTCFGERGGRALHTSGEIVINTCMTGYQEVLSDPSYAGQMVVMTYPLIGNYGASPVFQESGRPWARALITRQLSPDHQHWRAQSSLTDWLDAFEVPILTGCDTRRLARHLRGTGAQRAIIGPRDEMATLLQRVQRVTPLEEQDLVRQVSDAFADVDEPLDPALARGLRQWRGTRIVVVDFGVKRNTLRALRARGLDLEVVPYDTDAASILDRRPDAVVLSNGPGDPARLSPAVAMVSQLLDRVPVLGICLGHQLIAQRCRRAHLPPALRAPRRQPSGPGRARRPGQHDLTEPRVPGGRGHGPEGQRVFRQSSKPARRLGRRAGPSKFARAIGAVSSRGRARAPGQPGDLRRIPRPGQRAARTCCRHHRATTQAEGGARHRIGTDRDRPGGRVRLRRDAGVPGAPRGRRAHRAGQLEPGDDHDR